MIQEHDTRKLVLVESKFVSEKIVVLVVIILIIIALFLECIEFDDVVVIHEQQFIDVLDVVLHEICDDMVEKVEIDTLLEIYATHDELDEQMIDVMVELDDIDEVDHEQVVEVVELVEVEVDEVELEDSETVEIDDTVELVDEITTTEHELDEMVEFDEILDCGEDDELVEFDEQIDRQKFDDVDETVDVDILVEMVELDEIQHGNHDGIDQHDELVEIEVVE